jgi:hypothetical protein
VIVNFSIAVSFPSGLNEGALYDELLYDYDFTMLEGIAVNGDACSISFHDDLTVAQLASLDVAVAAHDGQPKPFTKKHYEQEFDNSRLLRETWWALSVGDVLSRKVEETLYIYSGSRLMSEEFKQYLRDGSVASTRTWHFKQEKIGTVLRVRKVEQ